MPEPIASFFPAGGWLNVQMPACEFRFPLNVRKRRGCGHKAENREQQRGQNYTKHGSSLAGRAKTNLSLERIFTCILILIPLSGKIVNGWRKTEPFTLIAAMAG